MNIFDSRTLLMTDIGFYYVLSYKSFYGMHVLWADQKYSTELIYSDSTQYPDQIAMHSPNTPALSRLCSSFSSINEPSISYMMGDP